MIWAYMEKGAAAGAWIIGFVCVLAVPVCLVALLVALFAIAFGKSEDEADDETDGEDDLDE